MSLEIRNITVKIGQKALVDGVSLNVQPGQLSVIIGPNGAGKSTLLKALCGDVKPDSGQVLMGGRPLSQWKLRDQAKVRAVLAQSATLTFPFSVMEVVLMGRGPHIRTRETPRDYAIAREALHAAHVAHLEARSYTTLSGGERQRVQLARILTQIWEPSELGTRYLLLDEPTNNLDLNHQHNILQVARRFTDEGVAVLAILHDLNLAAQYADHILMLKAGQSLTAGTPEAVLTPQNIHNAFGMPVTIMKHPHLDRPLIVPIPSMALAAAVDVDELTPLPQSTLG